jgi:hypothetical protein
VLKQLDVNYQSKTTRQPLALWLPIFWHLPHFICRFIPPVLPAVVDAGAVDGMWFKSSIGTSICCALSPSDGTGRVPLINACASATVLTSKGTRRLTVCSACCSCFLPRAPLGLLLPLTRPGSSTFSGLLMCLLIERFWSGRKVLIWCRSATSSSPSVALLRQY